MVIDKFWLDCMERANSRLESDWDKEKKEFSKTFAWPIKYAPSRVHDQDEMGMIIMDDPHCLGDEIIPLKYSEPSEEYIHTIRFMEQIKKDLESICYTTFYNGDSGDETKSLAAMGAGSGGWPTNSNDWAKVYQKAFPEAPTGQQAPIQQDPKDMAVKAETEEDRERLWQAVMDYGKGG